METWFLWFLVLSLGTSIWRHDDHVRLIEKKNEKTGMARAILFIYFFEAKSLLNAFHSLWFSTWEALAKTKIGQFLANLLNRPFFFLLFLFVSRRQSWKQKTGGYKEKTHTFNNHTRVTVVLCQKKMITKKIIGKKWHDFEKWQKWPFCEAYSIAKWSKMVEPETFYVNYFCRQER